MNTNIQLRMLCPFIEQFEQPFQSLKTKFVNVLMLKYVKRHVWLRPMLFHAHHNHLMFIFHTFSVAWCSFDGCVKIDLLIKYL